MPYYFAPGSCTVDINCNINLLTVLLRPSTTSLKFPGAFIPWPIITEHLCDNMDNNYNTVAHIYSSAQTSVFYHSVIKLA